MVLQEADLTTRIHKESLLAKIASDGANFTKLLRWSLLNEQPLGWRATWLLRQIINKDDRRISEVIPRVIDQYEQFNHSQRREWLKILIDQNIAEEEEGLLFDLCVAEWKQIHSQPALRASAIFLVFSLLNKYPDLLNELNHLMTSEYLDELSPGIKKGVLRQWESMAK